MLRRWRGHRSGRCRVRFRPIGSALPGGSRRKRRGWLWQNGWTADKKGASISFVIEGSCIAVQYRKSVVKPTCIAKVTIDDDIENARILDGNFEETWGDSLHLDTIAEHIENKKHKVKIEIIETHSDDKVPFYLVSVISSR